MERQNASVGTEQGVTTQHFNVPVFEVEGVMEGHSRGVERGLVVRGIRDREIRQGGDADGR